MSGLFPLWLFDVNGTRSNNVILAKQPPLSHNFSPFLDTRPGVDQNERFKALAGHPGFDRKKLDGLHSFASPDGIHWKKTSNEPVIPYQQSWSHAFDSQNVSFWSESEQLYIAYFRTWTHYRQIRENHPSSTGNPAGDCGQSRGSPRMISRTGVIL